MTRKALGRGLSALIPTAPMPASAVGSDGGGGFLKISIDKIRPNHLQPRKHFVPEKLASLAATIRARGLSQPIVVSFDAVSRSYELIAGERRWRAAQLAGLKEIDVVVRQPKNDQERLVMTLLENIQREDLNPIETALGFLRLMKEFGINQTEVAEEVGRSKQSVSNTLRLLDLPEEIKQTLIDGRLSEGHGRALLSISDPEARTKVFKHALESQLSVRALEELARQAEAGKMPEHSETAVRQKTPKSADLKALEESLQHRLGTKVVIRSRKNPSKGVIQIHYFSLDDFDRILGSIKNV